MNPSAPDQANTPQPAQAPGVSVTPQQPVMSGGPAAPGAVTGQAVPPKGGKTNEKGKGETHSTQNTLQIAEIRDGIVIMNDGSFRSVVMVKSINFDLMSPQEQEAVEYSYQGFLNSLYFPIQIFIRSQKVDLQPYIEKLDKIRTEHDNMLLALLMEDYIGYIDNLSQQTNIMDKKFYVVVPFFPVSRRPEGTDAEQELLQRARWAVQQQRAARRHQRSRPGKCQDRAAQPRAGSAGRPACSAASRACRWTPKS